jgi:hypothetical protein
MRSPHVNLIETNITAHAAARGGHARPADNLARLLR